MTPLIKTPQVNESIIQQWIKSKLDVQSVEQNLATLGYDPETAAAHLQAYKKKRNAKRQFEGFLYLGAGAFLGFLSCVITLVNPVPALYNWTLFGLTSLAVCVICWGLYCLFE